MAQKLNWTRDEVVLALELYLNEPKCKGRDDHPKVIALSDLLRSLPIYPPELRDSNFRNPAGVGLKLSNLARFNTASGRVGSRHGSSVDEAVWNEFANDRQKLAKTAAAIRALYSDPTAAIEQPDEEDEEASEGRILTRVHRVRERDRKIVSRKKADFLKHHKKLFCEACGFDFSEAYGARGDGFIEVHHTLPVSDLAENMKTKLSDLRLVCSNCHRMIHRTRPWLSWDALLKLVKHNDRSGS